MMLCILWTTARKKMSRNDSHLICLHRFLQVEEQDHTLPLRHSWLYWQIIVHFTIFDYVLLYTQCSYVGIHSSMSSLYFTLPTTVHNACSYITLVCTHPIVCGYTILVVISYQIRTRQYGGIILHELVTIATTCTAQDSCTVRQH